MPLETPLETVAIAGCGRAGKLHARAAQELGLRVVAHSTTSVNSTSATEFSKLFPGSRWLALDQDAICAVADLVVLALPPAVCDQQAEAFIKSQRHLLIEKPLSLSSARIRETLKEHAPDSTKVTVGYNRRAFPLVQEVKHLLTSDPLRWAEVTVVEDVEFLLRSKREVGGDAYLRVGSAAHLLDLVRYLFGVRKPETVRASKSDSFDWFTCFDITTSASNGAEVKIRIDDGDRSRRGIRLETQGGFLVDLKPLERLHIRRQDMVADHTERILERPDSFTLSFANQLRYFLAADTSVLHTCRDSLQLSEFVDQLKVVSS